MAFKRSAVRSRLSPPTFKECRQKPVSEKKRVFAMRLWSHVHSEAKLLKVDVEVNMQLVVPVNLHPLDQGS